MLPAVLLAAVYLVWSPPSADLAAQTFRADLFSAQGFELWANAWYGGLHVPGYSLLFGPLADLLGLRLAGALSVVAATALFAALVRPRYGDHARLAIWLFGAGAATNLFSGRLTFALGVAVGLGALVALDRGRAALAGVLAALTVLASPVAGLFVAFAGGVLVAASALRQGLVLALPALLAIAAVAVLFPTGGSHPFAANSFLLIGTGVVALVALAPRRERTVRIGALLYLGFCLAAFLVETPVGGNATRLGALVAAPLLALVAWDRRRSWMFALALAPLLFWQWTAPVNDLADAVGERSVEAGYYEPLVARIAALGPSARPPAEDFRVHVPPTRNRWEAVHVAERFPLARGWLRQAEADDFELFQDGMLDAASYRDWLDERGVALVAVSRGAEADYLAEDEIELIDARLPYLELVWSSADWDLYEVAGPAPLAPVPVELGADGFVLEAPAAGEIPVAVRFTPWYRVVSGDACVRERDGWTLVEARDEGRIEVRAELSAAGAARAARGASSTC